MKYQKWHIGTASEQDTALLKEAGYPSLLATVLAARGITTSEAAAEALERETSLTISPMLMRDMDKAVARIQKALANDETIAVFGDYDVDGITSTVLLLDYLKNCGAKCLRYIPRRIEDGYGLSKDAIQSLRDKGATLMITVDCGITGNEEIDFAASIGMDVVVTDHHECKENLPRAVAVVDPHRPDDAYPFKYLAGVGVALKLVLALGGPDRENALFARYCTLAAIGTIADVMRMEGENRTIVSCGLAALNHTDFVGIHALLKEAGLLGKPITSIQIGFVLSPRINAAGRMGAADLAADLLQETDPVKAEELAKQLCDLNRERQAVEQSICADAIAQIERLRPEERNALVLSSEEWHQGVVGIVASRLSEKYAAPSFMIHLKDGSGKGSCRSYGGFNLFSALESCSDLLDGFGGHELAAGFTIPEENIDTFRQRMNRFVKAASGGERAVSCLEVDAAISNPADMTLEQVDHLAQLEPYGSGNPRPVFALLGATVDSVQAVGQGKHLKLRLSKGPSRFDAIFFSIPEAAAQLEPGCRVDAAFYLQANTFRGTTALQLQLVDLRPSLTPSRHEAESLDLLHRLTGEQPLTAQETARLMISRDQFAAFWRILDRHLKQGKLETDLLPYLRSLAAQVGGCDSFLRAALALTVFQERGLISLSRQEDRVTLCLNPIQGKVYEIKEIITVVKAYSSAVGAGEFVSEIFGDEADELRRRGGDGGEFGATTGRPRRMGWLDLVATRYGCMVQGATQVAFTVLDVLGYLDEIPVCVGYELDGKEIDYFPSTTKLKRCKPILKKLKGWKCSISGITEYDKLPKECREYIEFAEKAIGVPITMVSNGPSRNDIIYR